MKLLNEVDRKAKTLEYLLIGDAFIANGHIMIIVDDNSVYEKVYTTLERKGYAIVEEEGEIVADWVKEGLRNPMYDNGMISCLNLRTFEITFLPKDFDEFTLLEVNTPLSFKI